MTSAPRILPLLALLALAACGGGTESAEQAGATAADAGDAVSGRIEEGLRVLTIDPTARDQRFRIYRGDYVRPERADGAPFVLEIPELEVSMSVPVPEGERAYFKVPAAGAYAFRCGDATGTIEAVEYRAQAYREVTPREAADFISARKPLILDVRTPREFAGGHLEGAQLLPVQVLQSRLAELADHRDQPVFIYCRTGNRSTVAAKLLIDAGHTEVVNLRRGIVQWQREGMPVVK
jgi:rhodanese-related sulfurtransferase